MVVRRIIRAAAACASWCNGLLSASIWTSAYYRILILIIIIIIIIIRSATVDGSEIQRSPVEVGGLSHDLPGFIHPTGGWLGFLNHQQLPKWKFTKCLGNPASPMFISILARCKVANSSWRVNPRAKKSGMWRLNWEFFLLKMYTHPWKLTWHMENPPFSIGTTFWNGGYSVDMLVESLLVTGILEKHPKKFEWTIFSPLKNAQKRFFIRSLFGSLNPGCLERVPVDISDWFPSYDPPSTAKSWGGFSSLRYTPKKNARRCFQKTSKRDAFHLPKSPKLLIIFSVHIIDFCGETVMGIWVKIPRKDHHNSPKWHYTP